MEQEQPDLERNRLTTLLGVYTCLRKINYEMTFFAIVYKIG